MNAVGQALKQSSATMNQVFNGLVTVQPMGDGDVDCLEQTLNAVKSTSDTVSQMTDMAGRQAQLLLQARGIKQIAKA